MDRLMIDDLWYRSTVIYHLDLETFMDADGDGVGDFEGLIRRLDYLHALGIGTIWLAPFQPTPNRDNGYDITDYYGVDPRHGTGGDFAEFMHRAHERGMRVILDLVVNHTSDEHPWFQAARSDPRSKYRDWYVWSGERPDDWDSGMVFPGSQKSTWTWDEAAQAWFFHRFHEFQPDLNVMNPQVRTEIRRIMGFWLELGAAGFRVDAVPFILESQGAGKTGDELRFEYLTEMRRFLQWRCRDGILLGEANVPPDEMGQFFGAHDDGLQMMFNFWVNQHLFYALATADAQPLAEALTATRDIPRGAQWAQFLRNHDELDLGRLTDKQRERVFARFGPAEHMQLYGRGIRRRPASMLADPRLLRLANSLLFSLPGTPVIRYGDEIGMGDDLSLHERDAVRTPMQWSSGPQAGFSTCPDTIHPVISTGPYSCEQVNVEAQRRDPDSLLNWTAGLIRLRKECPEIGWGDYEVLETGSPHVLALRYDWQGNSLLAVHNFADEQVQARITPGVDGGERLVSLFVKGESRAAAGGSHHLTLEPYGFEWYRVGGLAYALERVRE
jgi:maltose alpha-D-glucosyltransferase / alpha-amylase